LSGLAFSELPACYTVLISAVFHAKSIIIIIIIIINCLSYTIGLFSGQHVKAKVKAEATVIRTKHMIKSKPGRFAKLYKY